jgi:hypothetical protein
VKQATGIRKDRSRLEINLRQNPRVPQENVRFGVVENAPFSASVDSIS